MRTLARLTLLEITFFFLNLFWSLDFYELWCSGMSACLLTEVAIGYVTTGMGYRFSALPGSLMALWLPLVEQLLPPSSETGVWFPALPQVGKLVVACCWSVVYSTES